MSVVRTLDNGQKLTDWTEEINDMANQFGAINGSGLFAGKGTSQMSVIFDKSDNQINMISQTNRATNKAQKGTVRRNRTFSLVLPYHLYQDQIVASDIQGYRAPGTADTAEVPERLMGEKLTDMRLSGDQTTEFMKIQAMKGITVGPQNEIIANMFEELALAPAAITDDAYDQYEQRFELDNATLDPAVAIASLKRNISKRASIGGRIGKIEIMCTTGFFDKLVNHALVREAYLHYNEPVNNRDALRGDLQAFEEWGVVDTFEYKRVLFWTYDCDFNSDDGDGTITALKGIGNNIRDTRAGATGALVSTDGIPDVGYTVMRGIRNLYKGVFGPANTLSGANKVGQEFMVNQMRDPKDKYWEMELEFGNLYYMSRPHLSYRVYNAT